MNRSKALNLDETKKLENQSNRASIRYQYQLSLVSILSTPGSIWPLLSHSSLWNKICEKLLSVYLSVEKLGANLWIRENQVPLLSGEILRFESGLSEWLLATTRWNWLQRSCCTKASLWLLWLLGNYCCCPLFFFVWKTPSCQQTLINCSLTVKLKSVTQTGNRECPSKSLVYHIIKLC